MQELQGGKLDMNLKGEEKESQERNNVAETETRDKLRRKLHASLFVGVSFLQKHM